MQFAMFPPKLHLLLCFLACAPLCVGQYWTRLGNPQTFWPFIIASRNGVYLSASNIDSTVYYLDTGDNNWKNLTTPYLVVAHLLCVLNDGTIISGDIDHVLYAPSLTGAFQGNWTEYDYYDAACAGPRLDYFVSPNYDGWVQIFTDLNYADPGQMALAHTKSLGMATDELSMCVIAPDSTLWCGQNGNFVQMPTGNNLYSLDYYDVNNLIVSDDSYFVWYYDGNPDIRFENIPGQAVDVIIDHSTMMIVTPGGEILQWTYVPVGNSTVPAGTTTLRRIGFTYYIFTTAQTRANADMACAQYNSRVAHLITPGEVAFLSAAISSPVYVNSYKTTFNYGPSNCITLAPGASTVTTGANCTVALGYICKVCGFR